MLNRIVVVMVGLLAAGLVAPVILAAGEEETAAKLDAESILKELGAKLRSIPNTKEQCQALLRDIAAWQERKLKELEALKGALRILEPENGTEVRERPTVGGTGGDPDAEVWVVVHPMEVADYWVQSPASVKADGTWKTIIYIGRPGTVDVGKHFEIRAVANPKKSIETGDVLPCWPEAEMSSEVVEVTRK